MLHFFGLRKETKKSPTERESDGFVIVGETSDEKKQKTPSTNAAPLTTNVIVLPSKHSTQPNVTSAFNPSMKEQRAANKRPGSSAWGWYLAHEYLMMRMHPFSMMPDRSMEAVQSMGSTSPADQQSTEPAPYLLGDIPFTLAPHILAMQAGLPLISDLVIPIDMNEKLSSFCYDFTLENSVLCDP